MSGDRGNFCFLSQNRKASSSRRENSLDRVRITEVTLTYIYLFSLPRREIVLLSVRQHRMAFAVGCRERVWICNQKNSFAFANREKNKSIALSLLLSASFYRL